MTRDWGRGPIVSFAEAMSGAVLFRWGQEFNSSYDYIIKLYGAQFTNPLPRYPVSILLGTMHVSLQGTVEGQGKVRMSLRERITLIFLTP